MDMICWLVGDMCQRRVLCFWGEGRTRKLIDSIARGESRLKQRRLSCKVYNVALEVKVKLIVKARRGKLTSIQQSLGHNLLPCYIVTGT